MEALVVYPENKEQLIALKAVMKAMKITFEQKSEFYPDYAVNGVKESVKQADDGNLTPYSGIRDMLNRDSARVFRFFIRRVRNKRWN